MTFEHPRNGHKVVSLVLAAAMIFGGEGQVLAAMAATTGPAEQAATPGQPSAADLSAQAIERFQAKDYTAAVRLFEEAYKLDPTPNYLFNIGRVYEEKGDIRSAVDHYQRFVKEPGVEIEARELAVQRLRVLKAILAETDGGGEEPKPAETEPKPEGPKPEPQPDKTPPAEDPSRKMRAAGFALVGAGGAAMAVGGILGGVTLSKQNQLEGSHDYMTRVDIAQSGRSLALGTDVLLSVGGVLLVMGVILVGVSVAKRRNAVASRRVWPTGLGLAGRF